MANNNDVEDDNGHGTHVTSLIAAAGNNGSGIAGVAWNVQIMPVKFLDSNGEGTTANAVAAIYYAVNHGARVINASWGGIDYTAPLNDAIAYANAHNVVFVTAAGNDGTDNDVIPSYPASLRLPNELSVAAVDANGQFPSFSNYGPITVDIAAPGVTILGDYPSSLAANGLQVLSGTSMSTAYVSGVAALAGQPPSRLHGRTDRPTDRRHGEAVPIARRQGHQRGNGRRLPCPGIDRSGRPGLDPWFGRVLQQSWQHVARLRDGFVPRLARPGSGPGRTFVLERPRRNPGRPVVQPSRRRSSTRPRRRRLRSPNTTNDDLGRTASIAALKQDSGVAFWAQLIDQGTSDETVEAYLLASPEYLQAHGASPAPVAAAWYQTVLGRAADPAGAASWASLLWAGVAPLTVVEAFETTAEARATRVARWYTSYLGRTTSLAALESRLRGPRVCRQPPLVLSAARDAGAVLITPL